LKALREEQDLEPLLVERAIHSDPHGLLSASVTYLVHTDI